MELWLFAFPLVYFSVGLLLPLHGPCGYPLHGLVHVLAPPLKGRVMLSF